MNTLAVRLAQQGEFQEALRVSRTCCDLLENRYEENGQQWRSKFALALHTYSMRLADAGQLAESLIQAKRVVELRRMLCESEPGNPILQQDLADSLTNLSVRLEQTGKPQQAVCIIEGSGHPGRSLEQANQAADFILTHGRSTKNVR
jgi:hypothetical protein